MVDTIVILDVFLKREPFFQSSYEVLKQSALNSIEAMVTATAATDIYYLLNKNLKDSVKSKSYLEYLLQLVTMTDVLTADIRSALACTMSDFEDAIVAVAAERNKADYIVTRNTKDFTDSVIPAITPDDFLNLQ